MLLVLVLLTGCVAPVAAPPPRASAGESTLTVDMRDVKFSPNELVVAPGTTVTWVNLDAFKHTVTPTDAEAWGTQGSGSSEPTWLPEGANWSFTFTKAGTYAYYCIPHASQKKDGTYAGMTGTIIVGAAAETPRVTDATVVASPTAPARALPGDDGLVHVELEAREVVAQAADGVSFPFWTFNGTVPGPMLRVRVGDDVRLTLHNAINSTLHHSIDLHAVTGPGGGATVTQTAPGATTSFTFKALNAGLYVYHCASPHIPSHVANGMYGLILVEPEGGLPIVDREYYVVQGEIYASGALGEKGAQEFSIEKLMDERPEYYVLNGRVGALTGANALHANVNETVRIYFGVGGLVASSLHVIGEIFDAVYPEGGTPIVHDVQTTLVPAGGATMVELRVEVPGTYLIVDHALTHAIDRGAAGHLIVHGVGEADVFAGATTTGAGH